MSVRGAILGRHVASLRELAFREGAGIEVALLWDPAMDRVLIRVRDRRADESFVHAVAGPDALEASYHPFAHAARGRIGGD
jgi:hypothetical protein